MKMTSKDISANYKLARDEQMINNFLSSFAEKNPVLFQFILDTLRYVSDLDVSKVLRRVFALTLNLIDIPVLKFDNLAQVYIFLDDNERLLEKFIKEFDHDNGNLALSIAIALRANTQEAEYKHVKVAYLLILKVLFIIYMAENDFFRVNNKEAA